MTRRPNGTRVSDFLLLNPDSTNRFANKPTAVPPVLGDQDIHGIFELVRRLRRGFMAALILAGFIVGVGFLVLLMTGHI